MDPLGNVGEEPFEVDQAVHVINEERMFNSHVVEALLYSGSFLVTEETYSQIVNRCLNSNLVTLLFFTLFIRVVKLLGN